MRKFRCSHYRTYVHVRISWELVRGTAIFGNHWFTALLLHHPAVLYCNNLFEHFSGNIRIYFPNIRIRWANDARHTDLY